MPEETRPYLVNITRKIVHSTASKLAFCEAGQSDNVGYADEGQLPRLVADGFMPCPYCLREEADKIVRNARD
jgi:hypothetical protein